MHWVIGTCMSLIEMKIINEISVYSYPQVHTCVLRGVYFVHGQYTWMRHDWGIKGGTYTLNWNNIKYPPILEQLLCRHITCARFNRGHTVYDLLLLAMERVSADLNCVIF